MTNFLLLFFVFTLFALSVQSDRGTNDDNKDMFNVVDFGATGNGKTDDTQAFEDAWKAACNSKASSPTMQVPSGKTFLLQPLVFTGPCNAKNVYVVIDGTIIAPSNPSEWKCEDDKYCRQWIHFLDLEGLYISGSGTINGNGDKWWGSYCEDSHERCKKKPTGFVVEHGNNVHISGLNFKDNPKMHIAFERSTWVYVTDLTITAPSDSPNTDGIHLQHSQNVFIKQSQIGTGDDCISIGDGSSNVDIRNIMCGPGHGISIGSLGEKGKEETVENVHVSEVEFRGTENGARIKTWQGGKGYARKIVFEKITSHDSKRPIIIDQYYCDHEDCHNQTSAVKVSDVRYSNIFGTSNDETAVEFACSESVPCTDISMNDIHLSSSTEDTDDTQSICLNVKGTQNGEVYPRVPCLT
ncbi:probable polygalacturonase At1g80170 [Cornus florida]|uniref:probable polygalacturonase At1g80170 n=1 Tax=Cornus florida TaxID=4283 RepID=UPI0028996411|nr:probable polygalacturonase At1g80170 [Cornus florida]